MHSYNFVDATGKKFGKWTVVRDFGEKLSCRCDCGTVGTRYKGSVTNGGSQSCGKCIPPRKKATDITGERFGRLVAVKLDHIERKSNGTLHMWIFHCDCGKAKVIAKGRVLAGGSKSCGCLARELTSQNNGTHRLSKTKFYRCYYAIRQRCLYESADSYPIYGGRGIKVLWNSFDEFKDDMYESYLQHIKKFGKTNTQIDRIDSDGDYCKENCRWTTQQEQQLNKRNTAYIGDLTCKKFAEINGINYGTLMSRIYRGLNVLTGK